MRRFASLLLVILANVAILAHVAVPHHHDGVFTHIVSGGEEEWQEEYCHAHGLPTHGHHCENDGCTVYQTLCSVAFKSDDFRCQPSSASLYQPCHCIVAATPSVAKPCLSSLPYKPAPYPVGAYVAVVGRSIGLRAPPIC